MTYILVLLQYKCMPMSSNSTLLNLILKLNPDLDNIFKWVNKPAIKKFLKNLSFGVDVKCRARHLCIKLTHTTWVVWEARPQSRLKGCNGQLCMYDIAVYEYVVIFEAHLIIYKNIRGHTTYQTSIYAVNQLTVHYSSPTNI